MITDYKNYLEKLNDRLPKKLRGFEYVFLDRKIPASYDYDNNKVKLKKAPLGEGWNTKPLKNYTTLSLADIESNAKKKNLEQRLSNLYENNLNVALLIRSTPYCIVDVDSASITMEQLKLIVKFADTDKALILTSFLDLLSKTFCVESGNDGFHFYFKSTDIKKLYPKSKIKCFYADDFLTKHQINNFNQSVNKKFKIKENYKLDVDFLSDSNYVVLPPSSFTYNHPITNLPTSARYSVIKNKAIIKILDTTFEKVLRLTQDEDDSKKNRSTLIKRNITKEEYVIKRTNNSIFLNIKDLDITDINEILLSNCINKDRVLLEIYNKYQRTKSDYLYKFPKSSFLSELNSDFHFRVNKLIDRDYYDEYGYEFLASYILDDYEGMNSYANKKTGNLSYSYFSNIFKILTDDNYTKKDRSRFEYMFLLLEIKKSTNINILWEIIKKTFSPNTKVYDRGYFLQLVDKIGEKPQIKSNFPMVDIFDYFIKAQSINYRNYFGKSADSCASVFLSIIDRAIKIGRFDNNDLHYDDYWTISYESSINIGLKAHLNPNTVKNALQLLANEQFISLDGKYEPQDKDKEFLISEYRLITINKNKIFIFHDNKKIIPHSFTELQHFSGIGKTGSLIYSILLDFKPRTMNEIYKLFPDFLNPTTNINPKVKLMTRLGFLEFDEKNKTYVSSISKLASKLEQVRDWDFKRQENNRDKNNEINEENDKKFDSLKKISRSEKKDLKQKYTKNTKIPKRKSENTTQARSSYYSYRKEEFKKKYLKKRNNEEIVEKENLDNPPNSFDIKNQSELT